ncbi:MAG: M20 family metallopeptidase [bacterium]
MPSAISQSLAQQIKECLREGLLGTIALIRSLVEAESPSGDEAGSRAVVDLIARAAGELRCVSSVERVSVPGFGEHIVIKAFAQQQGAGSVLLVGHTDSVHPRGSLAERPWRDDGERFYGPGVFDMKANCALAIEALRVCEQIQIVPSKQVIIALTCDEEVGSASGWPLLEKLVANEDVRFALVLEPSAGGRVKTGRKGTGMFTMEVTGRAAHAGLEPEKGASAILELAKQIERLHALNNAGNGITVNVGVVRGGTRANVVAADASAEIDVRFATEQESRAVSESLLHSVPFDSRVEVNVSGGINRPPLERTPQVAELYELARSIARSLDFELGETSVGGASDGNFLASIGIPVLDGLGVDGDGAHATHEHIIANAIPNRGALLTGLIASL